MHALVARRRHTPGPPRPPLSSEKFIPHSRCAAKRGNERSGKEKRPARRGWPGARCRVVHGTTRHLRPLAARWPHPRCCLDEVSFPAGTKNGGGGGEERRDRKRRREPAQNFENTRILRRLMTCKFLSAVSSSTVLGSITVIHTCGRTPAICEASSRT